MRRYSYVILLLILCITFCSCSDIYYILNPEAEYDYSDWYETEIPTLTDYRAKIKIPNNWSFIEENNIIMLINNDTKEIIAEELCQKRYEKIFYDKGMSEYILSWKKINPNYDKYDVLNEEKYQYIKGTSNNVNIKSFCDKNACFDILHFNIYSDCLNGSHYLSMILHDIIDSEVLEQMITSFYGITILNCPK